MTANMKQIGKRNKARGSDFERRVRDMLESKGFYVSKFQSNVDIQTKKIIPAKGNKFMQRTLGFPDYIAWKRTDVFNYKVIGIECKTNGYLSPEERKKMDVLKDNNIFTSVWVMKRQKKNNKVLIFQHEYGSNDRWLGNIS